MTDTEHLAQQPIRSNDTIMATCFCKQVPNPGHCHSSRDSREPGKNSDWSSKAMPSGTCIGVWNTATAFPV